MASSEAQRPRGVPQGMEGKLGMLYMCGEQTKGEIKVVDSLLGRKVRGVCGSYDQFVALVDAWELEWSRSNLEDSLETELVKDSLRDVKVHHVAVGKNHRVALSLDGQLFSWGRRGAVLRCSELGHRDGLSTLQNLSRAATPAIPENNDSEKRLPSPPKRTVVGVITAGTAHRVLTPPELFFTKVSCGKHHSAAVTDNGDLYTWGRNYEGQLGRVLTTLSKEVNAVHNGICAWPKYVAFFLGEPSVTSVCCGNTFTAVLLADGSVYLLGGSSLRPSSIGGLTNISSLNLMLERGFGGEPFAAIACGYDHVLALTNVGEVFSWGLNTYGQLGHGGITGRGENECKLGKTQPKPIECDNSIHWAKVFAGGNYSAALTTDNQLFTWGNGSYGKLGHGQTAKCEFVPRCVEYLQHTTIGSVVCTERNLFAFAPTYISSIAPLCGEHTGGYELRLRGSGFWPSENLTVRFVPLADGRLMRGTLGTFCADTGEIVCQVPKFRIPGEFAVEVSMNGKHFTSNGRVFTVFKRPQAATVSVFDARFGGGEEVTIFLCGSLPELCRHPIIRFIRSRVDENSGQLVPVISAERAPEVVGVFDEQPESLDDAEEAERDSTDITGRLLRLKMPAFANNGGEITPYTLEISYDGGLQFSQVCVDSTLVKHKDEDADSDEEATTEHYNHSRKQELPRPASPHVIWLHEAQLVRVSPNSFLTNALPQTIKFELNQLLPPDVAQLLVRIVHFTASGGKEDKDSQKAASVSAILSLSSVDGNVLTCTIPPLQQWECSAPVNPKTQGLPAEWWKMYTKTGFVSQLQVSMNAGRNVIPVLQQTGKDSLAAGQVFGMVSPGRLLSLFPTVGIVSGGTQVAVAGDFFHFDTKDATVKLQWRESNVVVPATCLRPIETTNLNEVDTSTRRVVFQTSPLPFPDDAATAAAVAEGMVLGTKEEVEVFVSLDGMHFSDASLRFNYCAVPDVISISPQEAEPGTKMVLAVDKVVSTSAACIKLVAAESRVSMVVPIEIVETTRTAEFVLPELPIRSDELVHIALSLNGQEFTEGIPDATTLPSGSELTFRYKVPAS